jgi:hypothetical protein
MSEATSLPKIYHRKIRSNQLYDTELCRNVGFKDVIRAISMGRTIQIQQRRLGNYFDVTKKYLPLILRHVLYKMPDEKVIEFIRVAKIMQD